MKRRSICNFRCARTTDLLIGTTPNLVDSQCFPRGLTMALHQKWNSWCKFPSTSPRTPWRRRGLWGRINNQTQEARPWIPIPSQMERISDHWCDVGIRIGIFWWWQHANSIQRSTSTLKIPVKANKDVLSIPLSPPSIWNVSRMVWWRLEELNPMC